MINRNVTLGFSFGLLEVALYAFGPHLAIQPRVLARTFTLERAVVVLRGDERDPSLETADESQPGETPQSPRNAQMQAWWQPLNGLEFDDPEQEAAKYVYPNTLFTPLPWPGTWVTAFRSKDRGGTCGVFLGGRVEKLQQLQERLLADGVLRDLPEGTSERKDRPGLILTRREAEFEGDQQKRDWLATTMKAFINAIRPRLRKLGREFSAA